MRRIPAVQPLTELPDDVTLLAYRGKQDNHEQRLYLSVNGGGVFYDLTTGKMFEVDVNSALSKGYWTYVDGGVE